MKVTINVAAPAVEEPSAHFLSPCEQTLIARSPGGALKSRLVRGSVPVRVGSMETAGADRSVARIAVERSHVQNLRLDGRRMKNLLYTHGLSHN